MRVRIQALRVLSCMFLPLSVRVLRAAVIGVSSTLDWFENIDKMSPVWKLPIYKPSSRNFREKPAPSKSELQFVATNGSEAGKPRQAKQSDTSLKAACYLDETLSLVILPLSLTLSLYLSLFLFVSCCLSFVERLSGHPSLFSTSFFFSAKKALWKSTCATARRQKGMTLMLMLTYGVCHVVSVHLTLCIFLLVCVPVC